MINNEAKLLFGILPKGRGWDPPNSVVQPARGQQPGTRYLIGIKKFKNCFFGFSYFVIVFSSVTLRFSIRSYEEVSESLDPHSP